MDIAWTPDQLAAMAHARERESTWGWGLWLALLTGLAGASAYNAISISQPWARFSQAWMLAWACFLLWISRQRPQRASASESSVSFLQREFERKRNAFLSIRRYLFLLIPPIVASFWVGGGQAIRISRLKALGVNPSSGLYAFATGPWPFIITGLLLVLIWIAFGQAAKKATRELEELRRRTHE